MDELLESLTTFTQKAMPFKSYIFQAERVSINSQDSIQDPVVPTTLSRFSEFIVQLPKPCLNVKSLQLLRATVPNPVQNIPDSEATWWFYRLPNVTGGTAFGGVTPQPFTTDGILYNDIGFGIILPLGILDWYGTVFDYNPPHSPVFSYNVGIANTGALTTLYNYGTTTPTSYQIQYANLPQNNIPTQASFQKRFLHFVRLLPSWTPPELYGTQYGYNRTFTDYADLVSEVNKATVQDPAYTSPVPLPPSYASVFPTYLANDIQFNYNSTYNKVQMTGLQAYIDSNGNPTPNPVDPNGNPNLFQYWYIPAGNQDLNIFDLSGSSVILTNYAGFARQLQLQTEKVNVSGIVSQGQPYFPYRTLNLRLGFTYSGEQNDNQTFIEMQNLLRPLYGIYPPGTFNDTETATLTFNSYPDLVYTANVYVYTNVVAGSTQDTNNNTGLLAVIPMNTPNLGVGFYSSVINTPLTKIANEIYQLRFTMLTDTGESFFLPNSAIVNLELQMSY